VVGEGERGHLEPLGLLEERPDSRSAIQKGELAVRMKVDESGPAHHAPKRYVPVPTPRPRTGGVENLGIITQL
jgi:hypothetical protein